MRRYLENLTMEAYLRATQWREAVRQCCSTAALIKMEAVLCSPQEEDSGFSTAIRSKKRYDTYRYLEMMGAFET